jgi:excisionase family DNA binding protein
MQNTLKERLLETKDFINSYHPPLPRDFVYKALRDKRIRNIRVGKRYLIPVSEVQGFIQREISK